MSDQSTTVFAGLLLLLVLWLFYRRLQLRMRAGEATEVERRFENSLQRFKVEIDRFKFTRQRAVKILLNHDHAIGTQIETLANETGEDRETLRVRVNRYVEEIVPFFKPLAYYTFGFRIARSVLNSLYRIDYDPKVVSRIKEFCNKKPRTVVFLMNHRSNADYVLAADVLAEKIALSFAVGEWARVWPLEYVFKAFGSYFLRRGFRDPLYHTVLRRYVQLVTKNAVTQAMFPEGGLSRDGRLRSPKIGLIDSIICSKEDRSFHRELIFVPVAINYDRVLEDRSLVAERGAKPAHGKLTMLRRVWDVLFRNIQKFAKREIRKNGIAAVRFGEPVSFDAWHAEQDVDIFSLPKEKRRTYVAKFCEEMMGHIAELVPATPLCLSAKVVLEQSPMSRQDFRQAVAKEVDKLGKLGVEVIGRERGTGWIAEGALLRFGLRRLITEKGDQISIPDAERPILEYYANAIAHHYDGVVPSVKQAKPVLPVKVVPVSSATAQLASPVLL